MRCSSVGYAARAMAHASEPTDDDDRGQVHDAPTNAPSSPERFVWPPKKPIIAPPAALDHEEAVASDGQELALELFDEPVADGVLPDAASGLERIAARVKPPSSSALPTSRWSRWAFAVEQQWLGLAKPVWAVRAANANWKPDRPGEFCPTCGQSVGTHELWVPAQRANLGILPRVPKCSACRTQRRPWERCVRLGPYTALLREAIHEIKFEAWRNLGTTLGRSLGRQLVQVIESDRPTNDRDDRASQTGPLPDAQIPQLVLLPMPTTFRRRMARGIDHTLVIARGMQEILGGQIVRPIARDHRPSQLDVPPSARAQNVAGTFRSKRNAALSLSTLVILIDDVMTTGATMSAACRALVSLPRASPRTGSTAHQEDGEAAESTTPRVWAAVLGVTPTGSRRAAIPKANSATDETENQWESTEQRRA